MVVRSDDEIDRVFQAFADGTRRDIMARVLRAEQSVTDLADRYPMSFAAVQKHVAVLERAGLVTKSRRGREQIVSAQINAIRRAGELLDRYEALWSSRIAAIDALLAERATPPASSRKART